MCAGAIVQARVRRLVFGCLDPKGGAVRSLYRICEDPRLNHRVAVTEGVLGQRLQRHIEAVLRGRARVGHERGERMKPASIPGCRG